MCGLVGYAGFAGHAPRGTADTSLKEMTETLARRGPDASAVWAGGAAGLGHTRLATVDLVGGRQPLLLERGGGTALAVVFTGEVYNHAELRAELCAELTARGPLPPRGAGTRPGPGPVAAHPPPGATALTPAVPPNQPHPPATRPP